MDYLQLAGAITLLIGATLLGLFMMPNKKVRTWFQKRDDKNLFESLRVYIDVLHNFGKWLILAILFMSFLAGILFERLIR